MQTPANLKSQKVNAMTIDVEDYFQVSAFKSSIDPNSWDDIPCRVERNVDLILDLLEKNQVQATFFTLGWIAERFPSVIRKIVSNGHELASHGYGHQMISDLSPKAFREDIKRAKNILEDISGVPIYGYRAPSFSIVASTLWAHDILGETGHKYSSSVYPIAHDLYGIPGAPRFAYRPNHYLTELPATSVRIAGKNLPASGGGFFRLLPLALSKKIITKVNREDNQSAIFYCHPWEFDPNQPRVKNASLKSKFRHYINLNTNAEKFDQLLGSFNWAPIRDVFAESVANVTAPSTTSTFA